MPSSYDGIPSNLSGGLPGAVTIGSSTNATPIVVTTAVPHGCVTGDLVQVNGHQTNTAANGLWTVTVTSSTTLQLNGSVGNGVGAGTGHLYNMGYGASFQIPSDGDSPSAASVNVGFEANADRNSLLASNIGVYSDIGTAYGPVDPSTPFSSHAWGTCTSTLVNTWELVTTTPSPLFTKADFFNAGDLLDVSLPLSSDITTVGTNGYVYLSLWYAFRASSGSSPGTPAIIPGSGQCIGLTVAAHVVAQTMLTGKLVVPANKTTLDLYVYTMAEGSAGVALSLFGPYAPSVRIRRPTGFRSAWQ